MNTVRNTVEATRKAQGKSRQQLASAARTSPQYIHQLETGQISNPGIEMSRRLAEALGVDVNVLFPPTNVTPEPAASEASK